MLGNFRSALIVALSLPLAVLFTFIMMRLSFINLSANLMTLGGLAIAIGMIVDGSVVMVENIYRHLSEKRADDHRTKLQVVLDSSQEVARPILFGIGIILIVFLPLFLIIWRISQPLTLRLLSTSETNFLDGFWRIFLFDIVKVLIIFLAIKTSMVFLQDKDLLAITATTITTLIGLSFVHYFQTVYFVSPHKHLFSAFIRTWIHHFPEILFLHFIDIFVLIITFCLSGIVLASFIYLPFFLFLFISILVIYLLGRLFIIWKGLWAYAALSLITDRT